MLPLLLFNYLIGSVALIDNPVTLQARNDFDCPMRVFLLSYANSIQPFRSPATFQQIAVSMPT
jgi:hypothetical protein